MGVRRLGLADVHAFGSRLDSYQFYSGFAIIRH